MKGNGFRAVTRFRQDQKLPRCRAGNFSLRAQRKVTKRKGRPSSRPALRAGFAGLAEVFRRAIHGPSKNARPPAARPAGLIRETRRSEGRLRSKSKPNSRAKANAKAQTQTQTQTQTGTWPWLGCSLGLDRCGEQRRVAISLINHADDAVASPLVLFFKENCWRRRNIRSKSRVFLPEAELFDGPPERRDSRIRPAGRAAGGRAFFDGTGMCLRKTSARHANPAQSAGRDDGLCFLLPTFLCTSKEKYGRAPARKPLNSMGYWGIDWQPSTPP